MKEPCPTTPTVDQVILGIEVEKLRVDRQGAVSQQPFPTDLTPAVRDYVDREYFEAQVEFTLPPNADVVTNLATGTQIIGEVARQLAPTEWLWPYSCPPPLAAPPTLAQISRVPEATYPYRRTLSGWYDMRRLMNNGVHINVSFAASAVATLVAQSPLSDADALYMHVAQQFMRYQWVFVYLFGATPASFAGYAPGADLSVPVRSVRSGQAGFPTSITGDYRSLEHYVTRLESALASGELLRASQYYEPVRVKGLRGKAPHQLRAGISHLELRAFDLNPTTSTGVTADQLRLIQVMAMYFAQQPPLAADQVAAVLAQSRRQSEQVAHEDPRTPSCCAPAGRRLLTHLEAYAERQGLPLGYQESLQGFWREFQDPRRTLAYRVWTQQLQPALTVQA